MAFSKSNNGMTLMNVMFALAIAGTVLTPIFISQGTAMERILKESQAVKRLFAAQEFLHDAEIAYAHNAQATTQKELADLRTRLTLKEAPPSNKSALAKFSDVVVRTVSWQWPEQREQKTDQCISVVYKRKEKQE